MRYIFSIVWLSFCWINCSESPYAPGPTRFDATSNIRDFSANEGDATPSCGEEQRPCPMRCNLNCAQSAVQAASICAMTLEGKLSPDRQTCSFADESAVSFAEPLPDTTTSPTDLDDRLWSFTIKKDNTNCLQLSSELLSSVDFGEIQKIVFSNSSGTYRQEAASTPPLTENILDGGNSRQDFQTSMKSRPQLRIHCPNGKNYLSQGELQCTGCGDAGFCGDLPIAKFHVILTNNTFEFRFESGDLMIPLFTCK